MGSRLFDNPFNESTIIKNVVFDHIMPALSPEGWKVLCVAIRQAWGGFDPTSLTERKAENHISHDQFVARTGVKEPDVMARAIEECLEAGYLLRHQVGQDAQSGDPQYAYTLNTKFEIPGVAAIPVSSPGIEALPEEKQGTFQALMDFGREMGAIPDAESVREAVIGNDAEAVLAWIETGREMTHMEKSVRFQTVVQRLRDRVPPLPIHALASEMPGDVPQDDAGLAAAESEPDALVAQELWQVVLEELRSQVKKSMFQWLRPTQAVELAGSRLTVAVPTKRTKEWLEEGQLTTTVQQTVESVAGKPIELAFVVSE